MITRFLFIFLSFFLIANTVSAVPLDINVRETNLGTTGSPTTLLDEFSSPIREFFFTPGAAGGEGVIGIFTTIAFQIKNFFIAIAVVFLIIGVINLLFSANDEESIKKWRSNIIWVSVGIFIMQIAFSVWNTLILRGATDIIGSSLGWEFWINVFSPIVDLLQILASFGFLFMAVGAFFILVTAGGDEEKIKKAKNTILYAIIGFLLIRVPYAIVKAFYGRPGCEYSAGGFASVGACDIKEVDLRGGIGIFGKLFTYFNTFLSVICVILVIYAGWLVFISGGEEEKLKKAKNTILYIVLGFIVLVASHAIFRFFILKG
ncbi:hypothetical protein H7169_01545 [Candidatus Gracilibacteria bacterium]|nr:hypothetical protein [Candidatus Gracilibacteria bacterium]